MSKKPLHNRLESLFSQIKPSLNAYSFPEETHEAGEGNRGWSITCSPEGICLACGPEIGRWVGQPHERLIGRNLFDEIFPQAVAERIRSWLESPNAPLEFEFEWPDRGNGSLLARISAFVINDDQGRVNQWRGFIQWLEQPVLPAPEQEEKTVSTQAAPSQTSTSSTRLVGHASSLNALTATSKLSMGHREAVIQNALADKPATILAPLELRGFGSGLLEIVDETPDRIWTEDEYLLVEEVLRQLSLAIENAQLYAAVQQELTERTRAEQELLRRNQQLTALNEIGQQLSRLTQVEDIFAAVHHAVGQIADNRNLTLALFNERSDLIEFPLVTFQGEMQSLPPCPLIKEDLVGYVIQSGKSLWIEQNSAQELEALGIIPPYPVPQALIALPMSSGERTLGALILQSFDQSFTRVQFELLSTLATQLSISLQNANLFQEVLAGLRAIETRERYQAGVARAVATLSESGLKALPEVLQILGEASQSDRVFYATVKEDEQGLYWTAVAEWSKIGSSLQLERNKLQHMPTALFPSWSRPLRERGWVAATLEDLEPFEQNFLRNLNTSSILLLAVPGKAAIPGFIAFEQTTPRIWQAEEINILRLAADSVANTLVRQDLLEQLQASLDETENLYHLSTRMATAATLQEMVAVIPQGMRIPAINRALLLLRDDQIRSNEPTLHVAATWYSGRGTPPPSLDTRYGPKHPYYRLTHTRTPQFYEDVLEQISDPTIRQGLLDLSVRALAALPLWTAHEQLGALLLLCDEPHHFSGRELRTYPPLAGQMATEVENLRLFEQTQRALARTELLYRISNGIAQARTVQELADLMYNLVMPSAAESLSITLINRTPEGQPITLEVAGFRSKNTGLERQGMIFPASRFPVLEQIGDEIVVISDIEQSALDEVSKATLKTLGLQSGCAIPLRSAGQTIGLVTVSATRPITFTHEEIQNLQATANGLGIAIERYNLLREAQRRALQLEAAAQIARDTLSTLDPNDLLGRIVNLVAQRFGYYHVAIFLANEENTQMAIREAAGNARERLLARGLRYSVGSRSIIGQVASKGEPLLVNRVLEAPPYYADPDLPETRAEIALPLKAGNRVIGVLDIHASAENAFTEDDVRVLQILADQIAVAIENARAYELSQQAVEEMRRADRLKSQFLANMSHELRTPLNSIIGFSKVILKGIDGPITDLQRQDLTSIYNSGQHLLGLINDILDLSKIEAGKMELQFSEVNLADLINSVMSTAVGLVKDKPIQLHHYVDPNLPTVIADNTRVRQVLLNFLSNAAKFTEQGSITVEARLTQSPQGNPEVMITVTDTGIGIAESDRQKLFQPFSQVDDSPTRRTDGTGLGLSICRSLIELHGGRIGLLWSEVGKGSTFFFTLPVQTPQVAKEETKAAGLSEGTPTILAIEDDQQIVQLYERYLENSGYRIVALHDPSQAVATAKTLKPFAITLDIMMPGLDGWQVLYQLKGDPETRDIPVIICSILEEEEKGFSLGAADYLVKPFLQEDLISALHRLNVQGNELHLLIVDDSADDVRLLQKMLEAESTFKISVAESGQTALDMLATQTPDIILLDLFMPEMDGFQVLETLRTHPLWSHIPVIIITSGDLTPEQHQQLSEFGERMLNKSLLREKELIALIESTLQKWRSS